MSELSCNPPPRPPPPELSFYKLLNWKLDFKELYLTQLRPYGPATLFIVLQPSVWNFCLGSCFQRQCLSFIIYCSIFAQYSRFSYTTVYVQHKSVRSLFG